MNYQLLQRFPASNSYIQDLHLSPSQEYIAAVTSDPLIKLYDALTLQLKLDIPTQDTSLISEVEIDKSNSSLIWMGLKNDRFGELKMVDIRSGNIEKQYRVDGPVLSLSLNSTQTLLATGTELIPSPRDEALLMFWDIRGNSNPVTFPECHSDDITQVRFHPTNPNFLVTGSTDGLTNLFNLTTFDEDEALYQVIKDNSVHKLGFFGPQYEFLYLLTHMETFSMWKAEDGDQLSSFGDVRSHTPNFEINYLIDCQYEAATERLYLWTGSNDGSFGALHVGLSQLNLASSLKGGHSEIVRSVLCDPASFTSIVGPNGSGKSNVIDALLFVFGFKAKKMRQEKLGNLIHSSANFPDLDFCKVEVYFQEIIDLDEHRHTPIPNSNFVISRTIEKSTTSKTDKSIYKIRNADSNHVDRISSYTEITTLMKSHGVDLDHKRFLILQGEVELISQMKPKAVKDGDDGLLEYLEDIIGTSSLKEVIEQLEARVEEMNEERARKLDRVKLLERDKSGMEAKKDEALEFVDMSNQRTRQLNLVLQLERKIKTSVGEEASSKIEELESRLSVETEKRKSAEEIIKSNEEGIDKVTKELKKLVVAAGKVDEEMSRLERAKVEVEEKRKFLKKKKDKIEKALNADNLKMSENTTWLGHFDSDLKKINSETEMLSKKLEKEEVELDTIKVGLQGKTQSLQVKLDALQRDMAPWNDKVIVEETGINAAKSEIQILNERKENLAKKVEDSERSVNELKEEMETKKNKQSELSGKRKEVERVLGAAKNIIAQAAQKEAELKQKLTSARQRVEETKTLMQSAKTRGNLYKALMQQKEKGSIDGICGRLGDLGIIDSKYDTAITTCCSALDHIVVETVSSGQKCIEYLKKHGLGRMTFICLDQINSNVPPSPTTPENCPRLLDLIKLKEERFKAVFYKVLRDTVVAVDLKQGERVAFGSGKRWRVVTLAGQVIDNSGTMSGGGGSVAKGGMGSKFLNFKSSAGGSKSDGQDVAVADLEKEREQLEKELIKIGKEKKDAEEIVVEGEKELEKWNRELQLLEVDLRVMVERVSEAEKILADAKKNNRPSETDENRKKALEADIQKYTSRLQKLKTQMAPLQSQITDLQEQIMQQGGVQFRSQKAKVDGLVEQIDTLRERSMKMTVEKSTRQKAVEKDGKKLAKARDEMDSVVLELGEVEQESEKIKSVESEVRRGVEDAHSLKDEKAKEVKEIEKVINEQREIINGVRRIEIELTNKLSDLKQIIGGCNAALKNIDKQLEDLKIIETGFEDEEVKPLELYDEAKLETFDIDQEKAKLANLMEKLHERPNLAILGEYRVKFQEYQAMAEELREFTEKRDAVKKEYDDKKKQRLDEFMAGFVKVSEKLKEMYQMITLGGNAELELVDSLDPFSEGIIFSVMPPKKSWKNICNLSGGEKTLSSLALVFALHHFKPTPLYVMDEIDAALDFRNVSIIANYIKERTKTDAQFVIISLRNNMFELADRLVGIYKTNNTTKSITIDPKVIHQTAFRKQDQQQMDKLEQSMKDVKVS
ncbi:hypothetical protein HK098_005933 [Nowakowskiella sp. JEL0407]|nr:hypothetical protein HK098_005933 [Nowakowskiella sp. JEL0407]